MYTLYKNISSSSVVRWPFLQKWATVVMAFWKKITTNWPTKIMGIDKMSSAWIQLGGVKICQHVGTLVKSDLVRLCFHMKNCCRNNLRTLCHVILFIHRAGRRIKVCDRDLNYWSRARYRRPVGLDTLCQHSFEHNRYILEFENNAGIIGNFLGIIGEISTCFHDSSMLQQYSLFGLLS